MLTRAIGTVTGNTYRSEVFEVISSNEGYSAMVFCDASVSPNISVYESNGNVDGDAPLNTSAKYWAQVTTSGVASATEAFLLNRESFKSKYVYIEVDATGGSITNGYLTFNQK